MIMANNIQKKKTDSIMIEYQINAEYMFKMSYLTEIGAIDKNNATHGHCM